MILVKSLRVRACCTDCGRMAAVFRTPRELEDGIREALRRRLGPEEVLRARVRDMISSRHLLEVSV